MMYGRRIIDPDRNGIFNIVHGDDFEYSDPETKMLEQYMFGFMDSLRPQAYSQIPLVLQQRMTSEEHRRIISLVLKKANALAMQEIESTKSTPVPEAVLSIFTGLQKKEEEKIFNATRLSRKAFRSLILRAGVLGYKYSFYTFKQYPAGINVDDIPRFAYKDEADNSVFSIGDTALSGGQIKSLIDQTSTTVVKILDKGPTWHCFFLTFKGIAGKEKDHPPHMHYLSSSWGLTREQVLSKLRTKNYSIPSVHVWQEET